MNAPQAITVTLDGRAQSLPAQTCLADVVASLGHSPNAVATAVNGAFVPRGARSTCTLQEGDAVLLLLPIVGG